MKIGKMIALTIMANYGYAQNPISPVSSEDTSKVVEMPQIQVVSYTDRLLSRVPGSVFVIRQKQIRQIAPVSGNDVLRKIPGLNVVDEEGAGLRINIGVRGLDPDRSRNILVLEDGIPVALNPYGEPEMYFTPVIDKMKTVEVLKGSGQILFGPQTIGGVVNYITQDPPAEESARFKIQGGQRGFFSSYASYGKTVNNTGFIVSYLHKRADNLGYTNFRIHDLNAKIKFRLNEKSLLGLKMGVYDEISNSTYIGLTQTMYDKGGEDFVLMAPDDRLPVRRYSLSATHQYKISDHVSLQTTGFAYTTTRNWQRQEFTANASAPNQTGVVWGNPSVAGGAIYMLNANGHRNRQFQVMGIEPQLKVNHRLLNGSNALVIGTRLLYEKADEQFLIGRKADARGGDLRDVEERTGNAFSAYVQNTVTLDDRWSFNAGIRLENFDYSRRILRGRFRINGVNNVVADTNLVTSNNTFSLIPGAGISYKAAEAITLFAGVHKGFAPPRTKDAITSDGIALDLDAEKSINYEIGTRIVKGDFLTAEITGFIMNFDNQIIPVSQSSGNTNATGLANGGRTKHQGLEAAIQLEMGKLLKSVHQYSIGVNATYVESKYSANRFIGSGTNAKNILNNKLPYAPSLILNLNAGAEFKNGAGFRFYGTFTGEQFADELNTTTASANGLTGLIGSRFVMDASFFWNITPQVNFTLSGKNLFNERYIVSRRPTGIRVGLDRFISAGLEIQL